MKQKIEVINNWNIQKLLDEVEDGRIRIPRFQRDYVWERPKITTLLNSIYSQYPIGSFFLWTAYKSEYQEFCRDQFLGIPENEAISEYHFLLDGQQRLTSLYLVSKGLTLNDTDYSQVYFNVKTEDFNIKKNEKHNIEVHKIFNQKKFNDVYKQYILFDNENETNYADNWQRCQDIFSKYPISIIRSLLVDIEEVVTIFTRINQGGKRLTIFDIFHASTWSKEFDIREKIEHFNSSQPANIFGTLRNEIFFHSLSLNSTNSSTNASALKIKTTTCLKNWDKTVKSIELALDYLKNFGVMNSNFLPYGAQITVLQHYFYCSDFKPIKPEHKDHIEKWFWSSALSKRYGSSTQGKIDSDSKWIRTLIEGDNKENTFPVNLTEKDIIKIKFRKSGGIEATLLCLLALNQPRDFRNSIPVPLDKANFSNSNSKEHHHIFPKASFKNIETSLDYNLLMNCALITSSQNKEISSKQPSEYLTSYIRDNESIEISLNSHLIGEIEKKAMLADDYDTFVQARARIVLDKIKTILGNSYQTS